MMKIALRGVTKTFNGARAPLVALAPITLDVATGEFVCLIGPSGCGKSTLLRLIADQIPATAGDIRLDDAPPEIARKAKHIAWMAQNPALLPWQTVLDNVRLPQRVNRRGQGMAPAPEDLLHMVGLADFAQAYPGTLSGGMQQRVALARALATGAQLWLMDEPFAALDELTRETLTEEVLRLWETFHPTVLWVTHNIAEAARLADRVVVMSARPGRIRDIVAVTQPRPRDETAPETVAVIRHLRAVLRAGRMSTD
ncbi:MAG TPA: ABC transporter ATP-binding protein [Anaerolineae bacterium]|nr:ABC transporter ATP-binding protein [Anaerolineae bacterium]HQK14602.1 ABC transporter ATP-binding protein [Anaerolineae bacterium]